jgi:hypothetical protein
LANPHYDCHYLLEIALKSKNHIGLRLLEATIVQDILLSHIHAGDKPTLQVPIANGRYLTPGMPRRKR